ncbi:TniB family NTP-binding protein [Paraburkholderia sp. J10-1]|uniref:TniB family NTP-binding protein n=1 Tax=Paraburkholderia sp. J10-1 TaxID=2805430 RepID=UPI002AB6C13C|nr:TniB family NTP-binding protein [Paraburkholderia sp. J10-1]
MISQLQKFMVPLERHIRLAHAIDTMIKDGYIGREPRTAAHAATLQKLYEARQAGNILRPDGKDDQDFTENSSAFVGASGIGKTAILHRISRYYPVTNHVELGWIQIPWLHIEAPPDGLSVSELATTIRRRIEHLAPEATMKVKARETESERMNSAARLMYLCNVGLLIVDEVQRLKVAGKGEKKLLNLLVAASNELGIPILFVGTSKAVKLLGLDFSSARRSVGGGFPPWNVLKASHSLEFKLRGEWEHFIVAFWRLQWLQKPVELTADLSELMYTYCQGIVDIALKLFFVVQIEAIFEKTETITAQGIQQAWQRNFSLIDPMLAAYRSGDKKALEHYEDITPIAFESLFDNLRLRYQGPRDPDASACLDDSGVAVAMAKELVNQGRDTQLALQHTGHVDLKDAAGGVHEATKTAVSANATSRGSLKRKAQPASSENPNLPPDDYRMAAFLARKEGCSIFAKLESMGAVFDFDAAL